MTMGEKVLNMRKARGWSQEELADRVGVTRQAVSRWESGSAKSDADKIIAICDLFGVSADYLLRNTHQCVQEQKNESHGQNGTMTTRRWAGGILTLICGATLLVIWLMSVLYPVALVAAQKLPDFLFQYRLKGIWNLLQVGLVVGLWKLLTPKPSALFKKFDFAWSSLTKKVKQIMK